MNADLREVDYDKRGRIVKRCQARNARLHPVICEFCSAEWQAEHPFCERVECPDCHRLTQVTPDECESNFFVPDAALPTEEMLR